MGNSILSKCQIDVFTFARRHRRVPVAPWPALDALPAHELVAEGTEEGGVALEAVVEREDAEVGVQDLEGAALDRAAGGRVG